VTALEASAAKKTHASAKSFTVVVLRSGVVALMYPNTYPQNASVCANDDGKHLARDKSMHMMWLNQRHHAMPRHATEGHIFKTHNITL